MARQSASLTIATVVRLYLYMILLTKNPYYFSIQYVSCAFVNYQFILPTNIYPYILYFMMKLPIIYFRYLLISERTGYDNSAQFNGMN